MTSHYGISLISSVPTTAFYEKSIVSHVYLNLVQFLKCSGEKNTLYVVFDIIVNILLFFMCSI